MRYYLDLVPNPGESRWRQLGRKLLAGVIMVGVAALAVCLLIFFFSVFAAIVGTAIIVGLLAVLANSFRHPRTF